MSPYLFVLVMDRLFASLPYLSRMLQRQRGTRTQEPVGLKLSFNALLYADDTLLSEANEDNMELLLHTIELASDAFGLKLNKDKC